MIEFALFLRYCDIVARLLFKEKGPECPTCKHDAKMWLKQVNSRQGLGDLILGIVALLYFVPLFII